MAADIIDKRYKNTLRYAADLRTALEGVVKAWEKHRAEPRTVRSSDIRDLHEAMQYAEEILKQMEVNEQIREISND